MADPEAEKSGKSKEDPVKSFSANAGSELFACGSRTSGKPERSVVDRHSVEAAAELEERDRRI